MSIAEHLRDGPAYFDYNATTPVDPDVLAAMLPYLHTHFGNPSSSHPYGRTAALAVAAARAQVAALLGATPPEIVFTGSGSESNTLALRGALAAAREHGRDHIVTQVTEHPSVLHTCQALERNGGVRVTYLPVDRDGRLDLDAARRAIDHRTAVISVQLANGETGTLQPVAELATLAHHHGALLHTDASQAVGKIPTNVTELGVDLLTVAGHKLYAPKGIGALYLRQGVQITPLTVGGGQETGYRAGTENVPAIVGLGAACATAHHLLAGEPARLARLRDQLYATLCDTLPGRVHLNGAADHRLPNTLNISIDGILAADVLAEADTTLAASTASACHTGSHIPSPVLTAMGFADERALAAIRLSLGRFTTDHDITRAITVLSTV